MALFLLDVNVFNSITDPLLFFFCNLFWMIGDEWWIGAAQLAGVNE